MHSGRARILVGWPPSQPGGLIGSVSLQGPRPWCRPTGRRSARSTRSSVSCYLCDEDVKVPDILRRAAPAACWRKVIFTALARSLSG